LIDRLMNCIGIVTISTIRILSFGRSIAVCRQWMAIVSWRVYTTLCNLARNRNAVGRRCTISDRECCRIWWYLCRLANLERQPTLWRLFDLLVGTRCSKLDHRYRIGRRGVVSFSCPYTNLYAMLSHSIYASTS